MPGCGSGSARERHGGGGKQCQKIMFEEVSSAGHGGTPGVERIEIYKQAGLIIKELPK